MLTLSTRNQLAIGVVLVLLVLVTRSHHFATLNQLPGASWAVFFLAGVYLRSNKVLPGLLALTWMIDFASYTWGGSSGFCLTPAYVFLLPAYSAMWLAGRWYANHHSFEWSTLLYLCVAAFAGAAVCELISSGGFYFFSGRFTETTFAEFGGRLLKFFPSYLQSVVFYVGIAAVVHAMIGFFNSKSSHNNITTG